MTTLHRNLIRAICCGLIGSLLAVATARAQEPRIHISQLDKLADRADKVIDVTVEENLIKLALKAFNPNRSVNERKIKEILETLKGVFVKRYEFEKEGEYSNEDAESIRSQLNGPGWQRIANVRSKRQGSFDVVIMTEGSLIKGLAVFAAEPKALTIVNVVGPIDVAKLAELEGRFGIPKLGLEAGSPDADSKPPEKKPQQ
jgi:hypothetical protein